METVNKQGLKSRPPIVTVLGHVDHGKTTLLDYLRKTNVAAKEAGGITQSIGAYEIEHGGKKITLIDTPGHEAFSKMRSRGAKIADLAILVVAADDGVQPQTKEAIRILRESQMPFIVAINKIDIAGSEIDKVKNQLIQAEVLLEGYGGNISWHGISAKTGEGVGEFLDLILLASELEDLKYDPQTEAEGFVLESGLDSRRGVTATVIVKNGALKKGEKIATPTSFGKIKALENFLGKRADVLEPSSPALVLGFESMPKAGEEFFTGQKAEEKMPQKIVQSPPLSPETGVKPAESGLKVRVILKAEDFGSLEALTELVRHIPGAEYGELEIISSGIGDIAIGDVKQAHASNGVIIGFKVGVERGAETLIKTHSVKVLTSQIVYELVKNLELYLKEVRSGIAEGKLEILSVFGEKGGHQIIGGRVTAGKIKQGKAFEVWRNDAKAFDGRILNLQKNKKDAIEAARDEEAGLLVEATGTIKEGDALICK